MSRLLSAWLILTCMLVSTSRLAAATPELRAGAAISNITPELGGEIIGGFAPIISTHVHDDLHARCLVLDDGTQKIAVVVCDLLGLSNEVSRLARARITERSGIPAENVLISGTHTHSAQSALGSDRFRIDGPATEYQKFVANRIADGVARATNRLEPAELAFGTIEVPEHVFNRRWHMRAGTMPPNPFGTVDLVKMNPPAGSPNLEEPAGPTDPTISIVSVRQLDGTPLSVFATYSLHYVGGVGNGDISADYYGIFCEHLKKLVNQTANAPDFVALLANGTSGDINNINFKEPRPAKKPYEQMTYVAQDVATKVQAALGGLTYRRDISLAARYREPEIAWRKVTPEELAWANKTLEERPEQPGKTDLSRIYAQRTLALSQFPGTVKLPLQVLAIGDVAIGTMPCEVFCEIGLEFRERSVIKPAYMVSLNHGYLGYLPTPRQHNLGGYETWIGTNRLEREASVKMLNNLVEMTQEIHDSRSAAAK